VKDAIDNDELAPEFIFDEHDQSFRQPLCRDIKGAALG